METIGCYRDAARALANELDFIGSGRDRMVYVSDCGKWVYKVADWTRANEAEAETLRELELHPVLSVHLPVWKLYHVNGVPVMCMKRYKSGHEMGENHPLVMAFVRVIERSMTLLDDAMYYCNIGFDEYDRAVILDAAE